MSFKKIIYSDKGSIITFYVYYIPYIVNNKLFKSKKIESFLWDLIKFELYYVSGSCNCCANCCKYLALNLNGHKIRTKEDYNKLVKTHFLYKRFKPVFLNDKEISYFRCTWLKNNNTCKNYEGRLPLCRNYPLSGFVLDDYIQKECGFFIKKKLINPRIRNESLKFKINKLEKT